MESEKLIKVNSIDIDTELGLVFGYAIVCEKDGVPYFDTQGEHIPENVMLKASSNFMENSRVAKEMHTGEPIGSTIFAFPLTTDIAKSLGITTQKTGLIIAMKPNDEVLNKFKNKELTGFSIGGYKKRKINA